MINLKKELLFDLLCADKFDHDIIAARISYRDNEGEKRFIKSVFMNVIDFLTSIDIEVEQTCFVGELWLRNGDYWQKYGRAQWLFYKKNVKISLELRHHD